jgi:Domain of unknown function (DUF3854)
MSLGEDYLLARGIPLQFALDHGVQIDQAPTVGRIISKLGADLKVSENGPTLSKAAKEILWFPLYDQKGKNGDYIARVLPTPTGEKPRKFLCKAGGGEAIFICPKVWAVAKASNVPLIITEGPIKALACLLAGTPAIGLNGVWGAAIKIQERIFLRPELRDGFELRGRKVCMCFDADASTKPEVRWAEIRLFFLLRGAGAEVYQLTSWDQDDGKGIDDFLIHENSGESGTPPADTLSNRSRPLLSYIFRL